jgi:hypothetical protein
METSQLDLTELGKKEELVWLITVLQVNANLAMNIYILTENYNNKMIIILAKSI